MKIVRLPDDIREWCIPIMPDLCVQDECQDRPADLSRLFQLDGLRKMALDRMEGGLFRWGRDPETDTLYISRVK